SSLKDRAVIQARALASLAARSGGQLSIIRSATDLRAFVELRATRPRITAGILSLEGGHAFEEKIGNVQALFDEGFRVFGLIHTFDNTLGGSSMGHERGGLTPFGREVLDVLHRLGGVVDLAHASERVMSDVFAGYKGPVIITHTGVKGTCPNDRNIADAD